MDVTVTTPVGTSATSAADRFTYETLPSVTAISPVAGPPTGATTVTVTGGSLTGATAVMFGSTAAETFTVDSATEFRDGLTFAALKTGMLVEVRGMTQPDKSLKATRIGAEH